MEGDLGLMSSCLEGHGDSQHTRTLPNGTLDMVWVVDKGSDRPRPSDLPEHI